METYLSRTKVIPLSITRGVLCCPLDWLNTNSLQYQSSFLGPVLTKSSIIGSCPTLWKSMRAFSDPKRSRDLSRSSPMALVGNNSTACGLLPAALRCRYPRMASQFHNRQVGLSKYNNHPSYPVSKFVANGPFVSVNPKRKRADSLGDIRKLQNQFFRVGSPYGSSRKQ